MVDAAQLLSTPRGDRLPVFNILGTTFRVFGRAPLLFLAFSAIAAAPGLIRLAALGAEAQQFTLSAGIVAIINLCLAYLFQTAMTYLAARIYEGGSPTPREALDVGRRRYLPMIAAMLLVVVSTGLGAMFLFVPGIILLCMFAVTQPVCALEALGPIESMKRSRALTRGSRWRIFGIYIVFFAPLVLLTLASTLLGLRAGHVAPGLFSNAIISIAWAPVTTISSTVVYMELRRLKEHVGLATVFD